MNLEQLLAQYDALEADRAHARLKAAAAFRAGDFAAYADWTHIAASMSQAMVRVAGECDRLTEESPVAA